MLKEKLSRGESCIGAWLLGSAADNAEVLARTGLDFLVIDPGHGRGTLTDALAQLGAMRATPCAGLVRVPTRDPLYIQRVLDAGADGIMVPDVRSAEEARDAVAACRMPAEARCGTYSSMRRMDHDSGAGYHDAAAGRVFVVAMQVESPAAIDRIEEIAAVDGVDLIFIGSRDLSAGIGRLNRLDDPRFARQIEWAERAVLAAGRPLGSAATDGRAAARMIERGYGCVTTGSDVTLLGAGAAAMLAAARGNASDAPVAAASPIQSPIQRPVIERPIIEKPARVAAHRNADTSIRRMRQFWVAWCVAVLLLGAAVVGFGYLFALSADWSEWTRLGSRVAAGLLAAFAVYDAYRIAARGTSALQEVLAQNLASIVVAELERLQAAASHHKLALAAKDDPRLAGALPDAGNLGLSLTRWSFDGEDVRNLLGDPTEEALREVLGAIEAYNRLIDRLAPGDALAESGLLPQIEEISRGINRAMSSVAGRLDDYRHAAGAH